MDTILIDAQGSLLNYSYAEIVINMAVALVIGILLSIVYRLTHTGLSYSQSFSQTVVFVALIVAIVMMVIGGSLAGYPRPQQTLICQFSEGCSRRTF